MKNHLIIYTIFYILAQCNSFIKRLVNGKTKPIIQIRRDLEETTFVSTFCTSISQQDVRASYFPEKKRNSNANEKVNVKVEKTERFIHPQVSVISILFSFIF